MKLVLYSRYWWLADSEKEIIISNKASKLDINVGVVSLI